jgi:SSS family solute:Na+ symporter
MVQRYLCAKSLSQARLALVLSGFVILVQFLLFLGVGIGMYLLREAGHFPEANDANSNDEVFGLFIISRLPPGVVGVLVAAVLAAAMSTLSSSLNSSANAFVTDFYRPLRPAHSERFYVLLSRLMTAGWGLAQMGVAYAALKLGSDESVVFRVLAVAGFTIGLLLGLFILGSFRVRVQSWAALVGLVCGFVVVFAVWLPSTGVTKELDWVADWYKGPILAWPWFAPLGAGTTVIVALLLNAVCGTRKPVINPKSAGNA